MQQEGLQDWLFGTLRQKQQQSSEHKKALVIVESIVDSAKNIQNFHHQIANNQSAYALFIFGAAYKLLLKESNKQYGNTTALTLILNLLFPKINVSAIKPFIRDLQNKVFTYAISKESNPLLMRLCLSILSFTLTACQDPKTEKNVQNILITLFNYAIQSHRSNLLTKQSAKLLSHIASTKNTFSKIIADYAKNQIISDLDNEKHLYLFNVKSVVMHFGTRLINDISYRVLKSMHANYDTAPENYKINIYFFLEKMISDNLLTSSTYEQIIKQLISNMPFSADSGQIVYGYMQTLAQAFNAFCQLDRFRGYKYLPGVISIFQEFLARDGKVQTQAANLLIYIITNSIQRTLWVRRITQNDLDFEKIDIQQQQSHNFGKVICMMKLMLSNRFQSHKHSANILAKFFDKLDIQAWNESFELIEQIVKQRSSLGQKQFKKVFHSIFTSMGVEKVLQTFIMTAQGDISDEKYEQNTNLWVLGCLQKYEGQAEITTFMKYVYPIYLQLHELQQNQMSQARKSGYAILTDFVWRSLKIFCKKINKQLNYEDTLQMIEKQLEMARQNSHIVNLLISIQILCQNLKKLKYQSTISEKIISKLAKMCDLNLNYANQILSSIAALSTISKKAYLDRVFQKNIIKFLEEKAKGTINDADKVDNNIKNLQILIAVSSGVNFYDPTVITTLKISKQQLVVKLVTELLLEDNQFQKKSFKYMNRAIPMMPHSFTKEIIDILQNNIKIKPASKNAYLTLLEQIWNQLASIDNQNAIVDILEFIKRYLPDILISCKQNNKRARNQADSLFKSILNKITNLQLNEPFIEMLCAGFITSGTEMKIGTLHALELIIQSKTKNEVTEEMEQLLLEVFDLVLVLLKQKKSQLYKAVVEYCRKYINTLNKKQQKQLVPKLIEELFTCDQVSKLDNRSTLKHFLLKMIKKFDRKTVQEMIPEKDRKILSNAIKVQNQVKKKKKKQRQMRRQLQQKQRQQQQSSSQEEQNSRDHEGGMDIEENQQQLQNLDNTDNLLLKYDLQKEKFHFVDNKIKNKQLKKAQKEEKEQDVIFDKEGKMIVRDISNRRSQADAPDQDDKQQLGNNYINVKKKRKLDTIHQVKQSVEASRSNRAGGDLQTKQKPVPIAFIQFNSKALNKRFKKKAEKVFDSIFERKQGGIKGLKSRIMSRG